MKYLCYFLLLCITANHSLAQTPGGINYQGVARNQYLVGFNTQLITLRFTIREKTTNGDSVYNEVRNTTTDSFGVFNVVIGAPGAVSQSGDIKQVPWSDTTKKFLQVELDTHDPLLPPGFINMGTTQLLSVPFSFYSDISDISETSKGSGKYYFSATIPVDNFQEVPKDNGGTYSYVVKFPRVLYNEGNVYDSLTSTFTAPDTGIYQFDINMFELEFTEPVSFYNLSYVLMKNNTICKYLNDHSYGGQSGDTEFGDYKFTKQVRIKLAKGDKITIRLSSTKSKIQLGWFSDEDYLFYTGEIDPAFFAEFSGYKIK